MDTTALFQISYGLYLLTARREHFSNGCIVNTVTQLTSTPPRIAVTVNQQNLTHDLIAQSGLFQVSVLSRSAPFALFQHFGFQSGSQVPKIRTSPYALAESPAGLLHLTEHANGYLTGKVIRQIDLGTHTMFIADLIEAEKLSKEPSMTYADYHASVKPKPDKSGEKKGWRCKICGYVYEGEELPRDFVCPLCKHGPEDFEPVN